jgi:hypothetical protein
LQVTLLRSIDIDDTPALRKERGAFFTPDEITQFISRWAIRTYDDRVLEPAAGDAAFLVAAVNRLRELIQGTDSCPTVDGVEIHAHSVHVAHQRVREAGGRARIQHSDFFALEPLSGFFG